MLGKRSRFAVFYASLILAASIVIFLSVGLTMALGFYPIDATHTPFSTMRCSVDLPNYNDCNDDTNGNKLKAILAFYAERNASYIVCGCSSSISEGSCTTGQATWLLNSPTIPVEASCSFPPGGLWIFGVVWSSCLAVPIVALAVWVWRSCASDMRDADEAHSRYLRLMDPNIP